MARKLGRRKAKKVTDTPSGIALAAKGVRDLLAHYTNERDLTETKIGLLLFGYLSAKLGAARVRREYPIETLTADRKCGRPEQVDFAVGRKLHATGEFAATTAIEFAVRRSGHGSGADPVVNLSEIKKLVRAESKHRILLLLDITLEDSGASIVAKYKNRGYERGRPRGSNRDCVLVIYVGEHGIIAPSCAAKP